MTRKNEAQKETRRFLLMHIRSIKYRSYVNVEKEKRLTNEKRRLLRDYHRQ